MQDPFDTDDTLQANLRDQMRLADARLVVTSTYTARGEWMGWKAAVARRIRESIVGVNPWGNFHLPVAV